MTTAAQLAFDDSSVMVDSYGLPTSDGTSPQPSVTIQNPDQSHNSGLLATLEGWGLSAGKTLEEAGSAILQTGEGAVKTIYSGGKTVAGDIVGGVEGVVGFGVGQVVLVVAVIAVGLYFIGKTGAIKLSL